MEDIIKKSLLQRPWPPRWTDVTREYTDMIQAFECDLALAADPEKEYGLDDLQIKIEQKDERLLRDIGLLEKLSFGVRTGRLRIIEVEEGEREHG